MKFFTSALQGSVVFVTLLIGQIVIVASLALTALWLYFKRIQRENEEGAELQELDQKMSGISKEFVKELERKIVVLEEERAQYLQSDSVKALEAEKTKVQELEKVGQQSLQNVQKLEAQLLEFEVLKEEIGHLTQYKNEIQQLKDELKETTLKLNPSITVINKGSGTGDPAQISQGTLPSAEPDIKGLLNEIDALTAKNEETVKKAG
ncbi:MAG: hypothetical protein FJ112_11000 [Deltaproteobacteria bacterium]|nr:hypothetical protein [Deltaproteobacteria bacterium]